MNHLNGQDLEKKTRDRRYKMAGYRQSPFWNGVASTFDLFGINDFPLGLFKKMNAQRIKRNTISHDLAMVGGDMQSAINQYEDETEYLELSKQKYAEIIKEEWK